MRREWSDLANLVCEEWLDIDKFSPGDGVLEGLDAVAEVTRVLLLGNLALDVDDIVCDRFDGFEIHAMGEHQLLVDGPIRVEDDDHVRQGVVTLLLLHLHRLLDPHDVLVILRNNFYSTIPNWKLIVLPDNTLHWSPAQEYRLHFHLIPATKKYNCPSKPQFQACYPNYYLPHNTSFVKRNRYKQASRKHEQLMII